jgi:hypothetical protein
LDDEADDFVLLQPVDEALQIGGRQFRRCDADEIKAACRRAASDSQLVGAQE